MPRVKRGTVRRAKRKRLLSRAKGYFQTKSKLYRAAKEAVDKALGYAFVGRRLKKRDFAGCGSCGSMRPPASTA
jgi:large subunit ribosomal protein L20